ncbi:MAG: response regulator [Sphingomonadales bacterium]|nr:response regulator [Sphingomonadales bacterium]
MDTYPSIKTEVPSEGVEHVCLLVVEDSKQMRKVLQSMLSEIGVNQVFLAKDGAEALVFLADCDDMIDAVFCDWNMPIMSGVELLRQVRSVDAEMPFIMITGRKDENSVLEAKAAGITGYMTKPFSLNELESKVKAIARLSAVRRDGLL